MIFDMNGKHSIVIADRDRGVRDFLLREMTTAGFHVWQVKNANELIELLAEEKSIELLIIDPDFPDLESDLLLKKITDAVPLLPIILHTFYREGSQDNKSGHTFHFVEKQGNSIDKLIKKTAEIVHDRGLSHRNKQDTQ